MLKLPGFTLLPAPVKLPGWYAAKDAPAPPMPNIGQDPLAMHAWCWKNLVYKRDGTKDIWQTPKETLRLRTGDCEDWALLERAVLLANGIPEEHVWLVIVFDKRAQEYHAFTVAHGLMLDVRVQRPVPITKFLSDLDRPYAAFNSNGSYIFGKDR